MNRFHISDRCRRPYPAGLIVAVLISGGLLTMLWGCSDDATSPPADPKPALYALNPDSLVTLFKWAVETMDLEALAQLLAPEFRFRFQNEDVEYLGLPSEYLNHAEELRVMENISSGEPVTNWRGALQSPVAAITIYVLDPRTTWTESIHPDFPGAQRCLYQFAAEFTRPTDNTLITQGHIELLPNNSKENSRTEPPSNTGSLWE